MARTVSKSIASATVYILDPSKAFECDENGMPIPNVVMHLDGNPTENKARLAAQKFCASKNVMVMRIEVDETKLSVSPDVFMDHSQPCKDGTTYGREYVTQTFKITNVYGFYMSDTGMQQFAAFYNGKTTDNKLLNYIRETYGQTAIITRKFVTDERRFMLREDYLKLAR